MFRLLGLSTCSALFLLIGVEEARADFSEPPESPYQRYDARAETPPLVVEAPSELWPSPASLVRLHVGPVLLLAPRGPGLLTAIDVGRGAVGARVSGVWLRAESDRGMSSYDLELWADLRHRAPLHPVLAAGASLLDGPATETTSKVVAGVLRAALVYQLPIEDADARLAFDLLGLIPAVGTERSAPWVLSAFTLGAGF